ncbi:MAG TPA: UDP-glucose/GDP-mannose dehydrogenase family protein [Synergistales bacterium]|nr:UDP-glucose/GDP-mannose dehydrogenase family protein [Synergistales bacterium]
MNTVKIGIIGTGYVGLVTGLCLADFGFQVTCGDVNDGKIEKLAQGEIPIYEPGLEVVLDRVRKLGRISFTCECEDLIRKNDVIFICVGTPPQENGSADLSYVWDAARTIGRTIDSYKVVVDKSTVPVGTAARVQSIILNELRNRNLVCDFDVVSNPEFLREGKAVHDFTHPDRVVIGSNNDRATAIMKKIYNPLKLNEVPFVITTPETAEIIKYASNAFLATKIAFINEIANLCEAVNADVQKVAKAMGMDGRISPKFLHPGPGFGGSCFPKDTRALVRIAHEHGVDQLIVSSVVQANENQKLRMVRKIKEAFEGNLEGRIIAVLGLSFKPETDDMRESPSLVIIPELIRAGAFIRAFDPQAMAEAMKAMKDHEKFISYCEDEYDACRNAHAIVILTDWNQFRRLDLEKVATMMKGRNFFDLRNLYDPEEVYNMGFQYDGVGKTLSAHLKGLDRQENPEQLEFKAR